MKVDSKNVSAADGVARVQSERAAAETAKVRQSAGDASVVSSSVAAARAAAAQGRIARAAELKDAVRQGTYRPDPNAIADQILNDAEVTAQLLAMLHH